MRELRLGELCRLRAGSAFPQDQQGSSTGEIPFIKVSDMSLPENGKFLNVANNWITLEQRARLKVTLAEPGSVLFAKIGAALHAERFRVATRPTGFDNNMMSATANPMTCDANYLYYLLKTLDIATHAVGSALPYLKQGDLAAIPCLIPDLEAQKAIAEVLGVLDDKIAANAQLAMTAADLASATYDLARQQGKAAPAALSELVRTQYGITTSATSGDGPRLLRVTDINKKPWIEWSSAPGCVVDELDRAKYRLSEGDIVVARMADPGKAAYIDPGDPDAVFASYLVRLTPSNPDLALYIYYFLRSPQYQTYTEGATTGSVQRNMNAKVIVAAEIALPPGAVIERFNASVRNFRATISSHLQENARLAELRDALLPQLMSGRIRVKDAESVVEGVV